DRDGGSVNNLRRLQLGTAFPLLALLVGMAVAVSTTAASASPTAKAALPPGVTQTAEPMNRNGAGAAITLGPDGAIWFTERNTDKGGAIGRLVPCATGHCHVTETVSPNGAESIANGPDHALWFGDGGISGSFNFERIQPCAAGKCP